MTSFEKPKMEQMLSKVPEVTIYFWVIKVLCTTVGETAADFLDMSLGFGLGGTSVFMGVLLLIALFFQYRAKKYIPGIYWLTVVMVSVFGTLVTDLLTDKLHVPLETSTIVFSAALAITFGIWYASEKTLSIHSIFTVKRESFYWLAILFTFALGTAAGDLMAESLGLGYLVTGAIVCCVVAVTSVAWKLGLDSVLSFWIVYIMTRPLGASLGDYMSQSKANGGLNLGPTWTSVIFLSAIMLTVTYLTFTRKDMIKSEKQKKEDTSVRMPAFAQAAVVLTVMLAVAWGGYHWRQTELQRSAQAAAAQKTIVAAKGTAVARPLGDLSDFRTITSDTLGLVKSGKLSAAKDRVGDLETAWDDSEAKLKPMNGAKWTLMDSDIDTVLRRLRAFNQDANACSSSLRSLLAVIDKLDPKNLKN